MPGVKTWIVVSDNPRPSHAAIDGETVPLFDLFSIGMLYPGDPAGGPDEVAGCTCLLDVQLDDARAAPIPAPATATEILADAAGVAERMTAAEILLVASELLTDAPEPPLRRRRR